METMEYQKRKSKAKTINQNHGDIQHAPPPMNPALLCPPSYGLLDSADCATAAVPVGNFVYPESTTTVVPSNNHASIEAAAYTSYNQEDIPIALERAYEDQGVAEAVPLVPERDILTATYIPSYDENSAFQRAHMEKKQLEAGTAIGKMKNEDSDDAVQYGLRNSAYSNEWIIKEKIRIANKKGKERDKEGFAIRKEDPNLNEFVLTGGKEETSKQSNSKDASNKSYGLKGTGEYKISEYNTTDYSTGNYNVSEYKSIYDE